MTHIVNKNGKIVTKQLSTVYGGLCPTQNYNQLIVTLPQNWKRQLLKEEIKELVSLPPIKKS